MKSNDDDYDDGINPS